MRKCAIGNEYLDTLDLSRSPGKSNPVRGVRCGDNLLGYVINDPRRQFTLPSATHENTQSRQQWNGTWERRRLPGSDLEPQAFDVDYMEVHRIDANAIADDEMQTVGIVSMCGLISSAPSPLTTSPSPPASPPTWCAPALPSEPASAASWRRAASAGPRVWRASSAAASARAAGLRSGPRRS